MALRQGRFGIHCTPSTVCPIFINAGSRVKSVTTDTDLNMKYIKYLYTFIAVQIFFVLIAGFFFNYIEIFLKSYREVIANLNIITLFFIASFLKIKNFNYARIALIVSTTLTIFLISSALFSIIKLKELNREIFHIYNNINILSGKLINTDEYNFSYHKGIIAVPKEQGAERGRALPIPYYNYIDIEADDKSSRIRISCSISGYGDCRNKIQEDINIDTLDGLHGTAYIKPIHYNDGIKNLIFHLEMKNPSVKKDIIFFENLYKTELSYYYKIYLAFTMVYLANIFLNFILLIKVMRV